ncbi:MAG: helix-turn-helix transcriptional regulator, partial [Myxococcales bacterium]
RTERLLDLVALMLDATEPISWAEIREAFPEEYARGSPDACERKFERDKAELAELGIVLDYRPPSDDAREGYVLDRERYYLPELSLTPDEMAVLYAAGSAALASGAFPGRGDLAHALRKIAFVSSEEPDALPPRLYADLGKGKGQVAAHLEILWQALLGRKRVKLVYRGVGREDETQRDVDPWGICLRRGVWVLVGWCHLRKGRRTFHVDRIAELWLNKEKPRTPDYDVPADFDIADVAKEQVWEHRFHAPVDVTLELSDELLPLAERLFPGARRDGQRLVVTATFLDGLLRRVLPLGEGARVIAPAEAVTRASAMLGRVEAAHGGEEKVA